MNLRCRPVNIFREGPPPGPQPGGQSGAAGRRCLRRGPAGMEPGHRPAAGCRGVPGVGGRCGGRCRVGRRAWPAGRRARHRSRRRAARAPGGHAATADRADACIRIDPEARVARVEAGVVWLDVVHAAARHGLAALAGSSPDVGVAGYTLGGGMSFLGRRYGLAASNVLAIEMVTADGRLVRADHEHEPDLFWALRGGGGSFGVVTALEFRLFPLTHAYAGVLWYPIERGSEVLHTWGRADPRRGARRTDHGGPVPQPSADPADPRTGPRQVLRDRRGLPPRRSGGGRQACSPRCARSGPSMTPSPRFPCRC